MADPVSPTDSSSWAALRALGTSNMIKGSSAGVRRTTAGVFVQVGGDCRVGMSSFAACRMDAMPTLTLSLRR